MPSSTSLSNLRKFKRGRSGNPKGRPKKEEGDGLPTLKDWQAFALESLGADKNGKALPCRNDVVMKKLFLCATDLRRKDVVRAIIVWLERVYGKVPEHVNLNGDVETGENPIAEYLLELIAERKVAKARKDAGQAEAEDDAEAEAAGP